MADHGTVEYATAAGNDMPAHEGTYDRFTHLAFVGTAHVINIVIGLGIGGVTGHWFTGLFTGLVATAVAFHGLITGARVPSLVMVAISLLVLLLVS